MPPLCPSYVHHVLSFKIFIWFFTFQWALHGILYLHFFFFFFFLRIPLMCCLHIRVKWGGSMLTSLCSCSFCGSTMRCQSCARALQTPLFFLLTGSTVLLLRWLKGQKYLAKSSTSSRCLCVRVGKSFL